MRVLPQLKNEKDFAEVYDVVNSACIEEKSVEWIDSVRQQPFLLFYYFIGNFLAVLMAAGFGNMDSLVTLSPDKNILLSLLFFIIYSPVSFLLYTVFCTVFSIYVMIKIVRDMRNFTDGIYKCYDRERFEYVEIVPIDVFIAKDSPQKEGLRTVYTDLFGTKSVMRPVEIKHIIVDESGEQFWLYAHNPKNVDSWQRNKPILCLVEVDTNKICAFWK